MGDLEENIRRRLMLQGPDTVRITCPTCKGTGEHESTSCRACSGTGKVIG